MTLKQLINLADVQEKQAFAYCCYLNDKTSDNQLQKNINSYSNNLAKTFVLKHKIILQDPEILLGLRKHIWVLGADKPHSGHRFYEALSKVLDTINSPKPSNEDENIM